MALDPSFARAGAAATCDQKTRKSTSSVSGCSIGVYHSSDGDSAPGVAPRAVGSIAPRALTLTNVFHHSFRAFFISSPRRLAFVSLDFSSPHRSTDTRRVARTFRRWLGVPRRLFRRRRGGRRVVVQRAERVGGEGHIGAVSSDAVRLDSRRVKAAAHCRARFRVVVGTTVVDGAQRARGSREAPMTDADAAGHGSMRARRGCGCGCRIARPRKTM